MPSEVLMESLDAFWKSVHLYHKRTKSSLWQVNVTTFLNWLTYIVIIKSLFVNVMQLFWCTVHDISLDETMYIVFSFLKIKWHLILCCCIINIVNNSLHSALYIVIAENCICDCVCYEKYVRIKDCCADLIIHSQTVVRATIWIGLIF